MEAVSSEPEVRAIAKGLHTASPSAPRSARTKERLFLLSSCFRSAQYSPHGVKQWAGREGNTSRLLRKFIFRKQTQTSHRDGGGRPGPRARAALAIYEFHRHGADAPPYRLMRSLRRSGETSKPNNG
ncbi:hypothetical protein EYF80_039418 [Liparis tanakae]|uniref:Uncharacterized protein n=1 Tax=Liparis tanakae TaxID=230148 RepID=A0A4Z2GBU8_9TELE|nr:hypothetical protein EYF80_039418 [Liparis tanakae]